MSDRSVEDRSSRAAAATSTARDSVTTSSRRGGKRAGAGRKRGRFRKPAHRKRPPLSPNHPVHVTLRLQCYVAELRTRRLYHVLRKVLALYLEFPGFRIIHISIQTNHIHLIVEAADRAALTRGMQSFAINAARAINGEMNATGKVFAYRYHATQITTARQARNCLAYVLNNWRRHRQDVTATGLMTFPYDPYSSALSFSGWTKRYAVNMPAEWMPLPVSPPTAALLRTDYRRFGLIDPYSCPGPLWP